MGRVRRRRTVSVTSRRCRRGCDPLRSRHLRRDCLQARVGKASDYVSQIGTRQSFQDEMRELMVQPLGNDLRKWNALWPQQTRESESTSHRGPAVFRGNAHHNGGPIFEHRLEDIVVRTCREPAHFSWPTADRGRRQIAGNGGAWCIRSHDQERRAGTETESIPTRIGISQGSVQGQRLVRRPERFRRRARRQGNTRPASAGLRLPRWNSMKRCLTRTQARRENWVRRESLRLNPETDQWIEYATPKRYARDRVTRIDNSIDPIGVWYVDYRGCIARIPRLD